MLKLHFCQFRDSADANVWTNEVKLIHQRFAFSIFNNITARRHTCGNHGRHANYLVGQDKVVGLKDDRGAEDSTELRDATGVKEVWSKEGLVD